MPLVQQTEMGMAGKALIGYARVSTSQQGRSGLGLEAQKQALERFAEAEGFTLGRVFVEVETGKGSDAWSAARSLRRPLAKHDVSVALWLSRSWTASAATFTSSAA
jgi:DNA invertase Pin-like site-specific DNA recombinase